MLKLAIPYWSLLIIAGLVAGTVTIFGLRAKPQQGVRVFSMLMASVALWSFAYAVELNSTSLSQMHFIAKIEYIGIVSIAPIWFYFALKLNPWEKLKDIRILYFLFILPVIILLFVWTNDLHHLFWGKNELLYINGAIFMENTYGPVFWVHFTYSYILIIGGTILLFYRFMVTTAIKRYRIVYLLIPAFPLLANALTILNLNPLKYLDLTPFAFTISGLMLVWGASNKFQLEIIPIAHNLVFENMEDGFIVTDKNFEILDTNPAVFDITGFDENKKIQPFLLDAIKDRPNNDEHIQIELNGVLKRSDVLLRITPLTKKGGLIGRLVTLSDITQYKQTVKELQESEIRYETVFTGMRDAILVETMAGEIIDVNPSACELFGYSRDEFLSKTVPDIVPEDSSMIIGRLMPEHMEKPLQTYNKRSDGNIFPVEVIARPITISGKDVLLIVVRDITEKVKAEAALESRERYLKILNKITWDALTGQNLQEMMQMFADRLGELFEASAAYITIWDDEKQQALSGAAFGVMRDNYTKINPQSGDNTITKSVLKKKKPIIIEDIYHSIYESLETTLMFPATSIMALPLIAGDRKIGAAMATFDKKRSFTEEDIRRGSQAADQIALSISRSFLMEKTQELLTETRLINDTLEQRVLERTDELLAANRELERQILERQHAEAIVQTRLKAEKLISNLSSRFMDLDNFDSAVMNALKATGYITKASRTYIFMFEKNNEFMSNTYEWCDQDVDPQKGNLQGLPTSDFPWWIEQLSKNRIILIENVNTMPRRASSEQKILKAREILSLICYPVNCGYTLAGFLGMDYTKALAKIQQEDIDLLAVLARTIGSAIYRKQSQEELRRANEELRSAYNATIEGWARALELREKETAGHSERTVQMSIRFAKELKLDSALLEHIRRGALLHDIGKMVIPDNILQKPGKLTKEEWEIIRMHPLYSKRILGHIEYLQQAVAIPFYHHEKWDGSGYPEGLKGEEIPLAARLFALVDVWDALTSDRPYHKALPNDKVIAIIEKGAGKHFDPEISRVFIKMLQNEPDSLLRNEPCA